MKKLKILKLNVYNSRSALFMSCKNVEKHLNLFRRISELTTTQRRQILTKRILILHILCLTLALGMFSWKISPKIGLKICCINILGVYCLFICWVSCHPELV
jgi:hypothetical protein